MLNRFEINERTDEEKRNEKQSILHFAWRSKREKYSHFVNVMPTLYLIYFSRFTKHVGTHDVYKMTKAC